MTTAVNVAAIVPLVSRDIEALFASEIANERNGGVSPSTLSSTIDSVRQMPEDVLADFTVVGASQAPEAGVVPLLLALLALRDLLPGDTRLDDILDDVDRLRGTRS